MKPGILVALAALVLSVQPAGAAEVKLPLPTADPQTVGFAPDRLQRIAEALKREVDRGQIPGGVIAVARRGKLVYFEAIGFRDKAADAPMERDAVFAIASMTKPMAAVAAMILYEDGRLALNDPVGKYLPALSDMKVAALKAGPDGKTAVESVPAKRQPTIQDLLRHTSGIPYGGNATDEVHTMWPASSSFSATTYTSEEFLATIGKLPLVNEPGTVWEYSLSTDVVGLVVEAVSGKKLGEFLREKVWGPLGMRDTGFALTDAMKPRFARPLPNDPVTGKPQNVLHADGKPIKFDCGGGCALSTASDYIRFAQMLLNGGILDGQRILGPRTVAYMTSNHLGPEIQNNVYKTEPSRKGYGFGLGFAVRLENGISAVPGSAGDFNWAGAYGTYFWVDPKEELAVVYMGHTPGTTRQYLRQIVTPLVYQAIME